MGFIHPSQFSELAKEAGRSSKDGLMGYKESEANIYDSVFWSRDHKLGISTTVLLPLYRAAKHALMEAIRQYQIINDLQRERNDLKDDNASTSTSSSISFLESDIMKHSRALLLLSCDFGTAWNFRFLSFPINYHSVYSYLYICVSIRLSVIMFMQFLWVNNQSLLLKENQYLLFNNYRKGGTSYIEFPLHPALIAKAE